MRNPFFSVVPRRLSIGQFRLPSSPEVRRKFGMRQAEVWPKRGMCPVVVLVVTLTVSAKHF